MGLEIPDEFFPITPIRTSITRNLNSTVSPLSVNNTNEKNEKKNHHHQHHDRVSKKAKRIIIDEKCDDFGHEFAKLPDLMSTTNLQQDLVNTTEFSEVVVKAKEGCEYVGDEEECSTPKAEDKLLKTPLVCPPAPRKPKPLKRKNGFSSSTIGLFYQQVPVDLTSVFLAVPPNSKKIRAG